MTSRISFAVRIPGPACEGKEQYTPASRPRQRKRLRSGLAPINVLVCLQMLFLIATAPLLAEEEADDVPRGGYESTGNSRAGESEGASVYALREVLRLRTEVDWALKRMIDDQNDPKAKEYLIDALERCHEKSNSALGAADWRTRISLAELRRYRRITNMRHEQQAAYWNARSDLGQASAMYLRQLGEGRFRREGSMEIADCLLDATKRIATLIPNDRAVVEGYLSMVEVYCLREEYDSARERVLVVQSVAENCDGGEQLLAASHEVMGIILCGQKQYGQATEEFKKALRILRRWHGTANIPAYGMCLLNLAFAHVQQGEFLEADACCAQARQVLHSQVSSIGACFFGRVLTGREPSCCCEYCMASVHAAFGENQQAKDCLERYKQMGYPKDSGIPCPDAEVAKLAATLQQAEQAREESAQSVEGRP